jgi:hypothetical protein
LIQINEIIKKTYKRKNGKGRYNRKILFERLATIYQYGNKKKRNDYSNFIGCPEISDQEYGGNKDG